MDQNNDNGGNLGAPTVARKWKWPIFVFLQDVRKVFKRDALGTEIFAIAFPAAIALAADPVASLIDTAFIGHLGPVEIGAVGTAVAILNQAYKVTIFPLVSITTSFVAEEDTEARLKRQANDDRIPKIILPKIQEESHKGEDDDKEEDDKEEATSQKKKGICVSDNNETHNEQKDLEMASTDRTNKLMAEAITKIVTNNNCGKIEKVRRHIPSASTALVVGTGLGLLQTVLLFTLAKYLLAIMGVKSDSPMLKPAIKYLTLRALGAPAVLLSLSMQGIFRGFKDTTTPLYATVAGDVTNIILDPILIFVCRLGISGAAIAHVFSQYLILVILLWRLMKEVVLLPPSLKELQFKRFLKNGFYLLARVIAATICVTLAASLAARLGPNSAAAFQICLQVWITSSLMADGLAVAGQAIIASAFAERDYDKATRTATRVLHMGFVLGLGLTVIVGIGLGFGSSLFTRDKAVVHIINIAVPFVAGTQPLNSIAFVFDGVNFGASDYIYSAYSMVIVAIVSIASLIMLNRFIGFVGIWIALTIFMALRTFVGIWRMGTGTGPWRFLNEN